MNKRAGNKRDKKSHQDNGVGRHEPQLSPQTLKSISTYGTILKKKKNEQQQKKLAGEFLYNQSFKKDLRVTV